MEQATKNKTLIAAAESGSVEALKMALTSGADVNAVDEVFSRTVLMHAACSGNAGVCALASGCGGGCECPQ